MAEEIKQEEKKLNYVDSDGTELWGMKELNIRLKGQTEILKKYYRLAQIALVFVILVTFWIMWQIKRYHIIARLVNAIAGQ